MEFRHILFPVDFSQRATGAAPLVKAMTKRFDAKLTVLHAAEENYPMYMGMDAPILPELQWPEIEAEAKQQLADFAAAQFADCNPDLVVVRGDAAASTVAYAADQKVDLIAMATHGRGVFRAALLGSATAKIMHDAPCAVWTDAHTDQPQVDHGWKSILCAIDTGEESARLIRAAAELGQQSGAVVRIVHSVPGAEAGQERYFDLEFQRFLEDSAKESIAKLQTETGTNFEVCLGAGSPGKVVAAAVDHHAGDLVLIGHGHLRAIAGRFRSHAYGIIRSAACPVLSV